MLDGSGPRGPDRAQAGPNRANAAVAWPQSPDYSTTGAHRTLGNPARSSSTAPPLAALHTPQMSASIRLHHGQQVDLLMADQIGRLRLRPIDQSSPTRISGRRPNSASPANSAPHARPPPGSNFRSATFGSGCGKSRRGELVAQALGFAPASPGERCESHTAYFCTRRHSVLQHLRCS
jgi:hypothetical protein